MTQSQIIVKKVKKAGHKKHGGAWKVAYADFVTAMMAFFLLLWLLNAATQEQLQGISDYFAPISMKTASRGGGGLLAGEAIAEKGAREIAIGAPRAKAADGPAERAGRAREDRQLAEAEAALRAAVAGSPQADALGKSLLIDNTPEGLRVQIVDQEGLPMFPRGEAKMYTHTRALLDTVAKAVVQVPQAIAISGHTDALPFAAAGEYTNWELSADRANAVRRALVESGVPKARIARVVGKAATEPLLRDNPEAPANRRLSVVLLREADIPQ